ncbi:MAG: fibronectin type III domain-containing protein [Candidatus Roizmanbacteria bacterium]|nr:fibronectin type III domain-containing protein [Candidatus Roizmanbacteria bacterium]
MAYSALFIKKGQNALKILGAVSLITFVVGISIFVKQIGKQNGWQKVTGIDKLYVVNRTSHGFEVVWSTKKPATEDQWVEVGTGKESYPIMSKFDTSGGVYHATIEGLKPDTTYYFRVRVGTKTYILPSLNSKIVHTPKAVVEKPISPAYGKVALPSTRPYGNGLLIYEIDGFYPLAVVTKETGEWLMPLNGLVEKKSDSVVSVNDTNQVSIKLFSYPEGNVRTIVGQTRPLKQTIIAGSSIHIAQAAQTAGESVLGTYTQSSTQKTNETLSVVYPKENALIPGNTPLIRGTAKAGKDVNVLIQGPTKQYSYRTTVDEIGNWLVQNPLVLESGKYTILVNEAGTEKSPITIKRTFSIIKSGEQVLGVATGSPTLIPTMPPVVPTYANPTTSPVVTTYPTTIVPTRFVPTATQPVTGGGMSSFLFGSLFFIIVGAGLVIAF